MSGHPEREGGEGGGQPCSTETQILPIIRNSKFQIPSFRVSGAPPWVCRGTPKSRFHVSKCADSRILLCKFQIPSFRVSGAPPWVRRGIPKSRFHVSSWADSRQIPGYSSANSRFQDSECADSRILLGIFQIPSFRVSEAPSWVRAQGTAPKFQIPSFRVSEAPSCLFGPRQRREGTPKFQIPSFRVSEDPSWVAARGTHKFPESKTLIPRACQRREHRFQDTERSFYFRSCTLT